MYKKHLVVLILFSSLQVNLLAWGFYGHRLINRKAVYSLPIEMFAFYKSNRDFLEVHSVDPDKRRYVIDGEGFKHYIDLDRYIKNDQCSIDSISKIIPLYMKKDIDSTLRDSLIKGGSLPWNLSFQVHLLTIAFMNNDLEKILNLSAEIGHYASDAHVPLHTTENYNGQLSNQIGIHALWESRVPENHAMNYLFLSGKANYVENVQLAIWKVLLNSHKEVKNLLIQELELRNGFPPDRLYSVVNKGRSSKIDFSLSYINAYNKLVGDHVEKRMTESAQFIASLWYTAWVNAGQPDLSVLDLSGCPNYLEEINTQSSEDIEADHKH